LSLTRSARRIGAETTRVARPTSITIESASSTREMLQSQAIRSRLRVEIGSASSRSAGLPIRRFAFQGVDDCARLFGIDQAVLASLKLAHRGA
jgi:hypothetical protein